MKQLLRKLIAGVEPRFLTKDEQTYLATIDSQFLRQENGLLRFNSKYKPGIIKQKKDESFIFIGLDESTPMSLSPEDAATLKANDIILIQRIMGRSKKSGAKVVYVFDADVTYSIGIIIQKKLVELVTKTPLKHGQGPSWVEKQVEGALFLLDDKQNTLLKALGSIDDPLVDEAIALGLYNRKESFSSQVLEEVQAFGTTVAANEIEGRRDLRDLNFVTIDPVTAKDFDDAIYFDQEAHVLYVAIADVSHYVKEETAIDKTAYKRGFTVYFPHKSIPMLPRELSENLCSLMPEVDRLSFVFEIHLDPSLVVVKHAKAYEAVIHSRRRFDYDEIDALFEGSSQGSALDQTLLPMLKDLATLMDAFRVKRMKKGYAFRSPETQMRLTPEGTIESTTIARETPSHALIEDCMLLANIQAALSFEKGLYRVHETPSLAKLDNLYHQLSLLGLRFKLTTDLKVTITSIQDAADELDLREDIDTLLIQTQMQAHYSPHNVGHFGLGFNAYTHFTSPIRRYSDLVVHRLIKAHLTSDVDAIAKIEQTIEAAAIDISGKERQVDQCAKNLEKRKYARWAKEHLDQIIQAKVIYIDQAPKAVSITPIVGLECMLDTLPETTKLFDIIDVRLLSSDITTLIINGSYQEKL